MATYENSLDIPSTSNSLVEIEREIVAVHARRGGNLAISPVALSKRRGAFQDAAFLQMLITWSRLSPDAKLKLTSRNQKTDQEALLSDACDYSVGIALLAMAPFIAVDGNEVSRTSALAPAYQRIDQIFEGRYDQLIRGRCIDLLCVSGAVRQHIKPLFSGPTPNAVRDKFSLKATVRGLATQAYPRAVEFLDENTLLALATLTHELFENTQDHATRDLRGHPYRRHVEGLFVSWLNFTDEAAREDFFPNAKLRDYWATLASLQADREAVSGICFSFVDSGPGLAARFTGQDHFSMTRQAEKDALMQCLRVRSTTKMEQGAGVGLTEVLHELAHLNGLVRVRSGRLAIYKAFSPGIPAEEAVGEFDDWFESQELSAVSGTLVSIFIPLPRS